MSLLKTKFIIIIITLIYNATVISTVQAKSNEIDNECLIRLIKTSKDSTTLSELKQKCQQEKIEKSTSHRKAGAVSKRFAAEQKTQFDPYVITPHKMNYILPFTITDDINKDAYTDYGNWNENLEDQEAKFQISIKVPLNNKDLFLKNDGVYLAVTLESWWQIYSQDISKPFRETNYQPELFYLAPIDWHPYEGNTGFMLGIEHQSNGRTQLLSRSWNRVYLNFLYEKDNFVLSFKPWWRIPEDDKDYVGASDGDDNPDISDYMGHFELGLAYKYEDYEISFRGRENFSEHHGFAEVGFTFPLWGRFRGYAQYSSGYGESLIDYNHSQQRFGIGIALTNAL